MTLRITYGRRDPRFAFAVHTDDGKELGAFSSRELAEIFRGAYGSGVAPELIAKAVGALRGLSEPARLLRLSALLGAVADATPPTSESTPEAFGLAREVLAAYALAWVLLRDEVRK